MTENHIDPYPATPETLPLVGPGAAVGAPPKAEPTLTQVDTIPGHEIQLTKVAEIPGHPDSTPTLTKVDSIPGVPTLTPVDPLAADTPIEFFQDWKRENETPLLEKVGSAAKHIVSGAWHLTTTSADLVGKVGRDVLDPTLGRERGERTLQALRTLGATLSETGAEAYKASALTGEYLKSAFARLDAHEAQGSPKGPEKAKAALEAERKFFRSVRDLGQSSNDGRVIVDAIATHLGATENTMNDTPVDLEAAGFLANFVADPAIMANAVTGVTRAAFTKELAKTALRQTPYTGELHALERGLAEAQFKTFAAETELLAAKSTGAETAALEAQLTKDVSTLAEANRAFQSKLQFYDEQAKALGISVEENLGKGILQRSAGAAIEKAGKAATKVGELAGDANNAIDDFFSHLADGNKAGRNIVDNAASRVVPGFGVLPVAESTLKQVGKFATEAGALIRAPESSIPYFQRLERALPEGTVGRAAASWANRAGFVAPAGRFAFDTAEHGLRGAGIGAIFGSLNGEPVEGATAGALLGMAGGQFGQWQRFNSPAEVILRQQTDVALSRKRAEGRGKEALAAFDKLDRGQQLLVSQVEAAHPDMLVKLDSSRGVSSYRWNGAVGEISLDPANVTEGALNHELKHHLSLNPTIRQAVQTQILGDPDAGLPGIFTARDAQGRPIVHETSQPDGSTSRRFEPNDDFLKLKEEYLERLRDKGLPTTDYEMSDALIAEEIFAESSTSNLLERQPNGDFTIVALRRMGPIRQRVADALEGSELVANSSFLQRFLAKAGIVFEPVGETATTTGLFSDVIRLPGMREVLKKYNRMNERERAEALDDEHLTQREYTEAQILKDPVLAERFAGADDMVKEPATGRHVFIPEGEAKKRAEEFRKELVKELESYAGNEPGAVRKQVTVDDSGRKTEAFVGKKIPESVITNLEADGRFNEIQIANLRTLSTLIPQGSGTQVRLFYYPATKRGGKLYRTRAVTERVETPLSIRVTKDGNVVINTISQEKMMRNAVDMIKKGQATPWNNDFSALFADLQTYLGNHAAGFAGDANGLGAEKRDHLNSYFGQLTAAQRDANPVLQGISDRAARKAGAFTSRRLDRISRLQVLDSTFKADYGKISRNYSPGPSHSLGQGELKFTHYSDQAGLSELDPKFFGRSGITPRSEFAGLPRSYAYAEGSRLGQDKGLIDRRTHRYSGEVSKGKLYDGSRDPLGIYNEVNREKRDRMLLAKGYLGVYNETGSGVKQLEFLKPVKVSPVAKPSRSGVHRPRLHETDTLYSPGSGNPESRRIAEEYARKAGIPFQPHEGYDELPEARIREIADYFEKAKHEPSNPEVASSYAALIRETKAQYQAMVDAGIKIEPFAGTGEPYKNSHEMMADVRDNRHLAFFLTDSGFGKEGSATPDNPLLQSTGIKIGDHELLANDLFRTVHDFFGHTPGGFQFGARGEFNAWREHSKMFSEEAQGALAAETLAQNSWVNFGRHLRDSEGKIAKKGEPGYVAPQDRPFAEQKNFVVPKKMRQFAPVIQDGEFRISTRVPTAVKATEDAITSQLSIGRDDVLRDYETSRTIAAAVRKYPNTPASAKTPKETLQALHDQAVDNLIWLHDKMDPDLRERAKRWYDGARKLSETWANKYQVPRHGVAGVLASLSPQKDWFMNVDLARRVIEHKKTLADRDVPEGVVDWFRGKFGDKKPELLESLELNIGRPFQRLGLLEKAIVLRAYDEIATDRGYQIITPEGDFAGPATNNDGRPSRVAWGDFNTIAKALSIVEDPSRTNISARLGQEHKVRSFYNNILLPKNAEHGDVTIDTHAVAAALLRPLSGSSIEVLHNFGSGVPSSAVTGASGLYGLYAAAYRDAAAERGRLPREMQSITWEAIRGLFPTEFKTENNQESVDSIWRQYKDGTLTLNDTRNQIHSLAGGIAAPAWAGSGR